MTWLSLNPAQARFATNKPAAYKLHLSLYCNYALREIALVDCRHLSILISGVALIKVIIDATTTKTHKDFFFPTTTFIEVTFLHDHNHNMHNHKYALLQIVSKSVWLDSNNIVVTMQVQL